jgi:ferredoxin
MSLKKIFLPIFLSAGTIFAFIISFNKPDIDSTVNINSSSSNSNSSNQKKIDKTASNPQQLQKLSVLSLRCIGCGRCASIDPSHFEISRTTEKATVISSTNLNTRNLTMAINNCPVQAIVLE